jgi:hypothetical protein
MRPAILAVRWNGTQLEAFAKGLNDVVLDRVRDSRGNTAACVIEQVASYGMPVGSEVFETVYWSGRFAEAYGAGRVHRVPRLQIKLHLCHDSRAKDGNIRQALVDKFGGKDKAIGKKASPGPLYGVSGDVWAALALAVTWWDQNSAARLTAQRASILGAA